MNRYGPPGFTEPIRHILRPWLDGNVLDAERFSGLPAGIAHHIVWCHLPALLTHLRIENDPPMIELVKLAVSLPDAHLHGYIIGPEREDERIWFNLLCYRARPEPLPDLVAKYRPASIEEHNGWISVWWH
jgi:hypothetical protein